MQKTYTIIVPALDRTGPINVACDLGRAAANSGWQVHLLSLSGNVGRTDLEFAAEVRKWRVSDLWKLTGVIHTHCLRPDLLGAILGFGRNRTMVTTLHNFFLLDVGFNYSPAATWVAWQLWRRALGRFDHVVCISEAMRRYYKRLLPSQRFELAYNFRDNTLTSTELPARVHDWLARQQAESRHVLAYVGGLSRRKNVASVIRELPQRPDCALLVCGEGSMRAELEAYAASLAIADRVFFAGQVSEPSRIIAQCQMLVLPSLAEGFPLVVLEAASVGVPALLSNIAVHRELAKLGFGVTFDHRTGSNFSMRVDELLERIPAPSKPLRDLWWRDYSSAAGFARYANLITPPILTS